jgi:hypothetical protein
MIIFIAVSSLATLIMSLVILAYVVRIDEGTRALQRLANKLSKSQPSDPIKDMLFRRLEEVRSTGIRK